QRSTTSSTIRVARACGVPAAAGSPPPTISGHAVACISGTRSRRVVCVPRATSTGPRRSARAATNGHATKIGILLAMPKTDARLEEIAAAIDLLEQIAARWEMLDELPKAERERLQLAIAQIYNPDPVARRRRLK